MHRYAAALFSILLLAAAGEVAAAEEEPAPADTAAVAAEDSIVGDNGEDALRWIERDREVPAGRRVAPRWTVRYSADESSYQLSSGMRVSLDAPGGWKSSGNINLSERDFRGRNMQSVNHSISTSARKSVPDRYEADFKVGENFSRRKAVGLGRTGGNLVISKEYADAGMILYPRLPQEGSAQVSLKGGGSRGTSDFKYDRVLEGSAGAYSSYRLFGLFSLGGGYGLERKQETSTVGARVFGGMPSESDTIRAAIRYAAAGSNVSLTYQRRTGVMRKVDPPRGNSLEVLENPDLAQREESRQKEETLVFSSRFQPVQRLALDFTFNRDYIDQRNRIDERLSRETENLKIRAKAKYQYLPGGAADVEIERAENDIDYGPTSVSSYLEAQRTLRLTLDQRVGQTLRLALRGNTSLQQRYFKKKEINPRDVDYLMHSMSADLTAQLPREISAGARFFLRRYETINIDETLSGDNRTDYTYTVVPRFSFKPAAWLKLSQDYEIKMDFTAFTFKENENYLNRTTSLSTDAQMRFYKPLLLSIRHRYVFTDTGSYLRPATGGERLYGRTNESYENRLDLRADYSPIRDFKLFVYSNYRFQQSNRLGYREGSLVAMGSSAFDSGEMELGFERKRDLTARGRVDLGCRWVRRFGPNLTPERREFWKIDMNLGFDF